MSWKVFLALMTMYKSSPETVRLYLEDQEFRRDIVKRMRELEDERLDDVIRETEQRRSGRNSQ